MTRTLFRTALLAVAALTWLHGGELSATHAAQPETAADDTANEAAPPSDSGAIENLDEAEATEPKKLQPVPVQGEAGYAMPMGQGQDLFYNYYAQPGQPAGMYPAPFPTPSIAGHVYYTYQPLLPHEFLYPHAREYYTMHGYYHGYGPCVSHPSYTRTTVRWGRGHLHGWYGPRKHHPVRVPPVPCYQ